MTHWTRLIPLDGSQLGSCLTRNNRGRGRQYQVGPPSNNQQQGVANSPQTNDNGKLRELVKNGIAVMQAQEKLLEKSQKGSVGEGQGTSRDKAFVAEDQVRAAG